MKRRYLKMKYCIWCLRRRMWRRIDDFVATKNLDFLVVPEEFQQISPPEIFPF